MGMIVAISGGELTDFRSKLINRKPHLKELMKKTPGIALALDEYCALVIVDNNFKLLSFKENANGYQVYWKNGLYHEAILEKNGPFVSLESILKIM